MNYVTEYVKQIEAGNIITSKRVYKQYKKLAEEIANPGQYIFDEKKANRPIEFIERFVSTVRENGRGNLYAWNYSKRPT